MIEQEWLTSEDLFKEYYQFLLIRTAEKSKRKSILTAIHALSRIAPMLEGNELEQANWAVVQGYVLADGNFNDSQIKSYLAGFRGIIKEGNEHLAFMIELESRGMDPALEKSITYRDKARSAFVNLQRLIQSVIPNSTFCVISMCRLATIMQTGQKEKDRITRKAERLRHTHLFRDIFGNPFRFVVVDPAWLAWNKQTIPSIAQGIYDEHAFDRMPILGDALEEAGCNNADILNHCHGSEPHARGCWVVDMILGKK